MSKFASLWINQNRLISHYNNNQLVKLSSKWRKMLIVSGHCCADMKPSRPARRYQIFSVWSGIMGFERAVLMRQVEHELLIAIRKPKRGKQRSCLTLLCRSPHTQTHTHRGVNECFYGHRLDE